MSEAPILYDSGSLDEAAGGLLADMYARRGRTLYALCRMMLRDPHEAEDALQSTFLSAHRSLVSGNVPRDEGAWLATIARNECRGRIRERMRRPVTAEASELEGVADPSRTPEELLSDDGIGKALAALPESQREAVVLHDVFGLRAREVGAALGLSVPAVEAVLFRARRQLRTRLRPVGASVLSLPLGVQEALTLQVPGFAAGGAGAGTVAVGAGLLAKAVGAPTVLKVVAGAAALATAGSVAVVGTHHGARLYPRSAERGSPKGVSLSSGANRVGTSGGRASSTVSPRSRDGGGETAAGRDEHSGSGGGAAETGASVSEVATTQSPVGGEQADGGPTLGSGEEGRGSGDGSLGAVPGGTGSGSDDGSSAPSSGAATDDGKAGSPGDTGISASGPGFGSSGHHGGEDDAGAISAGSGTDGTLADPSETEPDDGGAVTASGDTGAETESSSSGGQSGSSSEPSSESVSDLESEQESSDKGPHASHSGSGSGLTGVIHD